MLRSQIQQQVLQSTYSQEQINALAFPETEPGSGVLIPPGGGADDVLKKNSATNFDVVWSSNSSGGLSSTQVKALIAAGVGYHNVHDFGAVGDNVADDTVAIQDTIDAAISSANPFKIVYAPAKYKITDTLHIGKGDQFVSVVLYGGGMIHAFDPNFKGGKFFPTFSDKPVVNIQTARKVDIVGCAFFGNNNMADSYDLANIESSYNPSALIDERYRGHFCITLDAFSGAGQGSSSFTAPFGWNKSNSSTVSIKECLFDKFIAGFVSHPSGSDGNGDFILLQDNIFKRCKYPISICQTQARLTNILRCQIDIGWKLISTNIHGKQQGRVNNIQSCHFSGHEAFSIGDMATNGPLSICYNYGEQLTGLGITGITASSAAPVNFESNQFSFSHEQRQYIPLYILNAYRARFSNCVLNGLTLNMKCTDTRGEIILDNTDLNINASYQFDPVLNWDANGEVYRKKLQHHPLSIGKGKLTVKEGTKVIVDRHYGGIDWPFYGVIGSNGIKYINTRSVPGASGILGDYTVKSRSQSSSIITNRALVGSKYSGRITANGDLTVPFFMKPGDVLEYDLGVDVMITKRGIADGLAHADDFEGVLKNGFTYNNSTYALTSYLFDTTAFLADNSLFTWWHCDWFDTLPVSGTVTQGTNTITGVSYNSYTEGQGDAVNQLKVGSMINYYVYTVSPGLPASKVITTKVAGISGTTITLVDNTPNGINGTALLFNRWPYVPG